MTITIEHGGKYITREGKRTLAVAKIANDKFAVSLPGGFGGVYGADGRYMADGRESEHDLIATA
jgi:hypothetical protein